jgi:methionine aminopeptidase
MWHPAKIRCGKNSVCSFREISLPDVILKIGDLIFIDIGPVFTGYEGDVGETFVVTDSGLSKDHPLCRDVQSLWARVAQKWNQQRPHGRELYEFARIEAEALGWELNLSGASGHRIGDFPHHVHWRGSLKDFAQTASENRWILEIQIRDRNGQAGAFFEDILKC